MSTAETTQAVEAAERAFPAWAKLTAKQRSNILRKWFDLIIANREDIALILTSEQGKPLAEALGEVDIGGAYVEFFAEEARRVYGETIPTQRADARLLAIKQPIGVCGAITPWNFPASMITRKVSPALAAGCTVVLKPANETPLTALALVALAEKAGVPKGVFNILTGNSSAIGKVLCEHPAVRFVGFTGSTEVGKILYQQAAVGVKKLGLELGGNAPFVVFDDADIDAAVDGAIVSKYRNMGQTCVCANRIYAQDKIYDEFVEKLSKKVAAMKIGDGTEQGVTQGPLINMDAVDKVEKHIADAVKGGAKIITGGKRHALGGSFFGGGRMLGDLQPGGTRELVRLAGDEGTEREGRVDARLLAAAAAGRSRLHAIRGRHRRVHSSRGVRHGESQREAAAHRHRSQFLDAPRKALLDPLQHEAVRRDQQQAVAVDLKPKRPDPGIELLRRELALEGIQAIRPERRGRRHGASGVVAADKKRAPERARHTNALYPHLEPVIHRSDAVIYLDSDRCRTL